ncbi:MAG: hypothetical protein GXP24_10590 [Planctomycetes bacterium]|nr:hypothetical protein [Planctomycetota bacterium]
MNDPHSGQHFRPHAAHSGKSQPPTVADVPPRELPSHLLHPESTYVRAMLEDLDDVVFSAVRGDADALEQAHTLWPQVVAAIGWDLVEESREQYLRFAIDVTQRFETDNARKPEHAVAALEVISLLTRD